MDVVKVAIESEMARTGCVMRKAVFGSTGDQSDLYITSFWYTLLMSTSTNSNKPFNSLYD